SFTVAALAHDHRSAVVLEAGGYDLAAAGTHAINQANHREFAEGFLRILDIFRVGSLWPRTGTRLDCHDQSIVNEHIADFDRTGQQSTRIEAQVKDEAIDSIFCEVLDRLAKIS